MNEKLTINICCFSKIENKAWLSILANKHDEFYICEGNIYHDKYSNLKLMKINQYNELNFKEKEESQEIIETDKFNLMNEIKALDEEIEELLHRLSKINQAKTQLLERIIKKQ